LRGNWKPGLTSAQGRRLRRGCRRLSAAVAPPFAPRMHCESGWPISTWEPACCGHVAHCRRALQLHWHLECWQLRIPPAQGGQLHFCVQLGHCAWKLDAPEAGAGEPSYAAQAFYCVTQPSAQGAEECCEQAVCRAVMEYFGWVLTKKCRGRQDSNLCGNSQLISNQSP
jgi:hypothetical protein